MQKRIVLYLLPGILFLAALLAAYNAVWMVSNIRIKHPIEYRESAIVLITSLEMRGENPYAIEYRPVYVNPYGILYHWAVYPLARVFGNTVTVHRSLSCFCIVVSCGWL